MFIPGHDSKLNINNSKLNITAGVDLRGQTSVCKHIKITTLKWV